VAGSPNNVSTRAAVNEEEGSSKEYFDTPREGMRSEASQ